MTAPFDYSLCDRCVTVYHRQAGEVTRVVAENGYFSGSVTRKVDGSGVHLQKAFTLILPRPQVTVWPGDRVYEGVGPVITAQQWDGFLPATEPLLWQAETVQPFYWEGELCHTLVQGEKA